MKDEEFGFGAPIENDRVDGYYYTDPHYQAFKASISANDKEKLAEALSIMKSLSGESQFKELNDTVLRIENTYRIEASRKDRSLIQFEKSTNKAGQKWLTDLYGKVKDKETLRVRYQPFEKEVYERVISPYLLKEYNNRWFLFGYDHELQIMTNLALDRIKGVKPSIKPFIADASFNAKTYLDDIVGVSIPPEGKKSIVKIKAYGKQRFYLETKPLHHSQQKIKEGKDFSIFQLEIIPNYELQSKILSNIDTQEVMSPKSFKEQLTKRVETAMQRYS